MAPNYLFEYVLKKYFRRTPPLPLQIYLPAIQAQPAPLREQIAKHCSNPEIIEALVRDDNAMVSRQAQNNEYWHLLGQYRRLLSMPRAEKLKFVRREGFPVIMVFVVFETDLKILEELYMHPGISIQMLNTLRRILQAREDEEDIRPMLQLIQNVAALRRRRILQVTEVFNKAKSGSDQYAMVRVFPFLLDDDEVVVRSAVNVLKQADYAVLRRFIFRENPFGDEPADNEKVWLLLERLQKYYRPSTAPLQEIGDSPSKIAHSHKNFIGDIKTRKAMLLETCVNNLDHSENLVVLAHAHLDRDPVLLEKLNGILNIEELLSLIADPTFPQAVSFHIMEVLKKHPSSYVQSRLSEIFLEIYERTRHRLREMEITINAYFDIIFNSLGNPQIHQIRQAFKVLDSAKKLTCGFIDQSHEKFREFDRVFELFGKIAEFYQEKLSVIYLDMAESRVKELEEVYEILLMIRDIPSEFLRREGYDFRENPRAARRMFNSTRTIWRSTLGQYLGRLREMDEMIRRKWIYLLGSKKAREQLRKEMRRAIQQMDEAYKKEMNCLLTNSCFTCHKRPCSSERYLRQVEFFLGELLDFVQPDESESVAGKERSQKALAANGTE